MRERILITGATGMLGSHLVDKLRDSYDIYATGNSEPLSIAVPFKRFDLRSGDFNELIEWSLPHVIIHCAALTNGNQCEQDPNQAFDTNSFAVQKMCLAAAKNTYIIYISTDAVFDNTSHLASETDCINPKTTYGKSKELGEFFLKRSNLPYTILRTTIVGIGPEHKKNSFVDWILQSIASKTKINLFEDVTFTPISIYNFSEQIGNILADRKPFKNETFHVAGSEICSKYDFGMALISALDLPQELISRSSIESFDLRANRNKDLTLDSSKYERLTGKKLPDLSATIADIIKNYSS